MTIRYCTPEWLEESAKLYRATDHFEKALKKVTTNFLPHHSRPRLGHRGGY